jgi:hypothetical protein
LKDDDDDDIVNYVFVDNNVAINDNIVYIEKVDKMNENINDIDSEEKIVVFYY